MRPKFFHMSPFEFLLDSRVLFYVIERGMSNAGSKPEKLAINIQGPYPIIFFAWLFAKNVALFNNTN
jgi:hypothetical protein